jgi:hypothetical protein
VRALEPVEVNVPVHPACRSDRRFGRILWAFPNVRRILLADQIRAEQCRYFCFDKLRLNRQLRRKPFAHFLAHEHGVCADVNDPLLLEQPFHQRFDMRVNQRFAATDGDHWRVALGRRPEAIFQAHHILQGCGVFTNPPATGAGQVASVQRLKLKNRGELLRATQLMPDHVGRDFRGEREWKSHKSEDSNRTRWRVNRPPKETRSLFAWKSGKSCPTLPTTQRFN